MEINLPQPQKENKTILIIIIAIILLLLGMRFAYNAGYSSNENLNSSQSKALNDSIRYFKNKYNEEVAEKAVYVGTTKELLGEAYIKDTLLKVLQSKISRLSDNVTVLKQRLSMTGSVGTVISHTGNKPQIDDRLLVYPTYSMSKEDSLIEIEITANSDTIAWRLQLINYLSVEQTMKREGFLNLKKEMYVEVTNSNPYIRTEGIQSFKVKPKPKEKLLKTAMLVGAFALGVFIAK